MASTELHNLIFQQFVGIDPNSVGSRKFVPITIFLSIAFQGRIHEVEATFDRLLDAFCVGIRNDLSPNNGSWPRRLIGQTKEVMAVEELHVKLRRLKLGFERKKQSKGESIATTKQIAAVNDATSVMSDFENFAYLIGDVLIYKIDKGGASNLVTRTLLQEQLIAIEEDLPTIVDPAALLRKLSSIPRDCSSAMLIT